MLLTGEAAGWRREADHGAVAVLSGRKREESVGHRLRHLRPLPQALLPKLLPSRDQRLVTAEKEAATAAHGRAAGGENLEEDAAAR
ncbi:hypothetical protein E2562_038309 [Oryza meyeriana var. granulata]|uniref:Uncharacterized protein n=1 Tax=Oryza meyeriana var. granulata TaxID=110450 RepID=A0A6G1ECQ9_9ORYZ|nr:hypothetical protein E2562_038309 [Oryza meyeriana var. granulata]